MSEKPIVPPGKPVVMVSSTARDLPDYRAKALDGCLRASMFPQMMEQLPALPVEAVKASLAMVDEAEIYLGIFAHRYGYVPDGYNVSITQMEYERALERGIPILIFMIADTVPVLPKDFDKGDSVDKLEKLKEELKRKHVVAFFDSPQHLQGLVFQSLTELKEKLQQEKGGQELSTGEQLVKSLHHVNPIPPPPKPYIAHPYTLLQVRGLIGRKDELELLTDWVTKREYQHIRIFNVVAIGGMGKSALTWTWFNNIAPQEMKGLAGRLWWSFYESDATFENFITRALAYVSGKSIEEVEEKPFYDQQIALLNILDQTPFLFVLDGLERILVAYARQDAAYLRDEEIIDETENDSEETIKLPKKSKKNDKHRLRKTADYRVGQFLRKLAGIQQSRILISTRIYPADLEVAGRRCYPGCDEKRLEGLSDTDALELWRAYGAKGSRETMLPVFQTFDKHPLLIQLLAYEVAEFHNAPGDFDEWKKANPDFNPFDMPIENVKSHVLSYAMRGISSAELRTLHIIAGFRMPASMDTVKALLIRKEEDDDPAKKPFATLSELDTALSTLEDRGLLGWDRQANRYDLHPIVRGVVWNGMGDTVRTDVCETLRTHFEAMPMIEDWHEVESLEDLTSTIELYNTLLGLKRYDEAFEVFRDRLESATLWRLSASRLRVELLEKLFVEGLNKLPQLSNARYQSYTLNTLALGYHYSGQLKTAITLLKSNAVISIKTQDNDHYYAALCNMSETLRLSGELYYAESSSFTVLKEIQTIRGYLKTPFDSSIRRDRSSFMKNSRDNSPAGVCFPFFPMSPIRLYQMYCYSLNMIGLTLANRGLSNQAKSVLIESLQFCVANSQKQAEGFEYASLAELELWMGNAVTAMSLADRAWELSAVHRHERDFIRAARLQGIAALYLGDFEMADERLHHALTRARAVQLVEEELQILTALAEFHRQKNEPEKARDLLEDVWEPAERGPYPIFHADALNVLAQIERDAGNTEAAIAAATQAYEKSWCDGPPYTYHWGLEKAKKHLAELNAPEPAMPPFDPSKFDPMPEVEIDPEGRD